MKKKFSIIALCLLFAAIVSMFSVYPAIELDTADVAEDISSKKIETVTETAVSSSVESGLLMKIGSNYMLNKGSRASIYNQDGHVYGSPVKVNGVVYVPARPIARDYLSGSYGWANSDGTAFNLTTSGKTAVVTIGSCAAVFDGSAITLDAPPVLVKGEGCENTYLCVALSDVEKLFYGQYVTYDDMGLIAICSTANVFNRDTDLNAMVNLMKRFIFDYTSESDMYSMISENTNGFDHPYLIGSTEKFDYMYSVWSEAVEDEFYHGLLEYQILKADGFFERFTTLPDEPANYTFEVKASERDPGKYAHLAFEINNPFSGIKEGEIWTDSESYTYHKAQDENGDYFPSVLHDTDNGPHYNDGYDYAGSRNSAGVNYSQIVHHTHKTIPAYTGFYF